MTSVYPDKVEGLVTRARREIDDGLLPSCQIALAVDGELIAFEAIGDATPDTRYVIMSCTKGLTCSAIWLLLSEGSVSLDQRVAEIIPAFGDNGKDVVTVEHVLRHTAGFPHAFLNPYDWPDPQSRANVFSSWYLQWEPGSRYSYHGLSGAFVLAEIIERVTGSDYREFIRTKILDPLALTKLRLGVPRQEQDDIADLDVRGHAATAEEVEEAWGVKNYAPTATHQALVMFRTADFLDIGVPGANGVSTAADLAMLYQAILQNKLWDPDVIKRATSDVMTFPDDNAIPTTRGLGLQVNGDHGYGGWYNFGKTNSPHAFGHDGAGGMIAWADPATGISFSYLTNGLDQHIVREKRRAVGLSSRAAVCATA